MKKPKKVHCLFEQSGTFKNEFIRFGIPAEDYDILNDYKETDHVIDLFDEIEKAYCYRDSIFDKFKKDDLLMAFFPCTRFEEQIQLSFRGQAPQFKKWSDEQLVQYTMKLHKELHDLYELFSMMVVVCLRGGLRLIVENPYHKQHYLRKYFPIPCSVVDDNRWLKGDAFVKPTQYWFINCDPGQNLILEGVQLQKKRKASWGVASDGTVPKDERSLMTPEYANRFIREYILEQGNEDKGTDYQTSLFEQD